MNDQHNDLFNNNFNEEQETSHVDLKFVVKLFFVSVFYMLVVGITAFTLAHFSLSLPSTLLTSFVNLAAYSLSLSLIIKYATGAPPQNQLLLMKRAFNWRLLSLAPVLIICTLALYVWIDGVAMLMPMPEAVEEIFNNAIKEDVFSLFTIIIVAPVLEEILCRGIILKGLLKNYSPDNAIGISALFFGAIHLNPWQAIPALIIGIFTGWVFYKTKSVLPGIIIHITVNATSVLISLFVTGQQNIVLRSGIPDYILLCIFSAVIFAAGCIFIRKKAVPE
ncbi:hypothetical protein SAMN05428949_7094 [Chitinophaga sp. YR627]|uniref:CPBP family intramembrane glutamic endopeptidase n=1 Tax=Chitinophaga sp. YR627 TaxID=1881041 RepID=UPI0008EF562B|nr:type II CAAX endopeptidase family protein [Chitinophaga sp. YR627]SFO99269.1 hypothetical protein SAMN05428949_7094 [Chitinophaga sp. YR627]